MTQPENNPDGHAPRDLIRLCAEVIERVAAVASRGAELRAGSPEAIQLERRLRHAIATIEGTAEPEEQAPDPLELLGIPDRAVLWLEALAEASEHDATPAGIVVLLAIAAADGARRPGSWERPWISSLIPLAGEPRELIDCEHAAKVDGGYCAGCGGRFP